MLLVGRGGHRREGSITSVARGLFGRAFGTSESDPRFISGGKSNKNKPRRRKRQATCLLVQTD
jgi:hypothetical protein